MRLHALLVALGCATALELPACPFDHCGVTPAAAACPAGPRASQSAVLGSPERVFFRNDSPRPVALMRVDDKGAETEEMLLPPAGRYAADSQQGALWRARAATADGRLLLEHAVAPVTIRACACSPRPAPPCRRPAWRGYRTSWEPVVFENDSPLPVALSWFDGDCAEALRVGASVALPPFSSARFISTYGHTFRAHALGAGAAEDALDGLDERQAPLLREHTIGDVVIRACDDDAREAAGGAGAAVATAVGVAAGETAAELRAANNALRLQLEVALVSLSALSASEPLNATASTPAAAAAASLAGVARLGVGLAGSDTVW
jgi:hypothetical protein